MSNKHMTKVNTRGGETIEIDTSDKALETFGVKVGDRIRNPDFLVGTVLGVAPHYLSETERVVWYDLDEYGGEAFYNPLWKDSKSFDELGFEKLAMPVLIALRK